MRRALALAACVGLLAPAVARAEVVDDNPAAASGGPGRVDVFIRGSDGRLLQSQLTSAGTWTPWHALDGPVSSGPAAFAAGGRIDLWARGNDFTLYHRFGAPAFNAWESLGGFLQSAPTANVRQGATAYVDVYARAADNTVVQDSFVPNQGWTGWANCCASQGYTLSAPAEVSRAPGYVDVFMRGTNDLVFQSEWNGSTWNMLWTAIGGSTQSAPAVVSRVSGTMDLFIRTASGQIAWRTFDGAVWTAYRVLPGGVSSAPAATTDGAGRIYLFARSGGDVAVNVYSGGAWSGWRPIHPPPRPVVCAASAGRVSARVRTVAYGRHPRVRGRLLDAGGRALPGVGVAVTRITGRVEARAVTRPDGRFTVRLPRGHDRRVHVIVPRPALHALACSAPMTVRVRAGVRLHASRTVRPFGRVHFTGRLLGRPFPHPGKLIALQAFDGGRWRTFATPRASRRGRFRASYRLQQTFGPRTFRFRARVPHEAGYPYERGYSRTVRVRVV